MPRSGHPSFRLSPLCFLCLAALASVPAASADEAQAKKPAHLSAGTALENDPQMQALEKIKDEIALIKQELVPLAKGMEGLRHSYDTGADPRSLTQTRKALRAQFQARLDRFDTLRTDLERIKDELEQRKIRYVVGQFARRQLDTDDTREQWVAIEDMSLVYRLNNNYRDRMESLKNQEEEEYRTAVDSLKKKEDLLLYLGGGIGVLIVLFSIGRWRMRVLGQPDALPAASGAFASYVLLGGTFRLDREWGKDRLGVYYGAVDVKKGGPVTVWLLREDAGFSPAAAKAAAGAAQMAAEVRHPGIAGIIAILQEDDRLCLVLDPMEGSPLSAFLAEGKRASLATAVEVVSQASAALHAAHGRRVLHGRLRPADIAVSQDGRSKVHLLGVPQEEAAAYMAPEQAAGALLPASDVFSLAACAYEFLTGAPAFPGPDHGEQKRRMLCVPPSQAAPGLPKPLDEVFRRAFFPDPAQRYRSCVEFASALEAVWSKEKRKRSGREA